MFKRFVPYAHAKNIYEVNITFFLKHNIKYIFLDLDNTLDSYRQKTPSHKAIGFVKILKDNKIEPIILSNNTSKRVAKYATMLGVNYLSKSGKPFAIKINRYIKKRNLSKKEILLVGDQLMTDISAANGLKIKSIFVEKLVDEDQITTRFNRLFEKPVKKYLIKHNKLIDWRNL